MGGEVRALAVCATGLAAVRLLLGLDAAVEYPFLQEASQTGVWLAAVLPWAVLVAGSDRRFAPPWFAPAQAVYAAFVTALTVAVFVDSRAKAIVLGLLTMAVGVLALRRPGAAGRTWPWRSAPRRWMTKVASGRIGSSSGDGGRGAVARTHLRRGQRSIRRGIRRYPGTVIGMAMLMARLALAAVNMSEAVGVGGTRVGISVFYTPSVSACWCTWSAATSG